MKIQSKSSIRNKKQGGFIMTTELVLLTTTMVVGMIVGLVSMRDSVNAEMEDVAEAIGALDQSYAFDGIKNNQNTAVIAGSGFDDAIDALAGDDTGFTFVVDSDEGPGSTNTADTQASSAGLQTSPL
ncbi:hypothetical protein DOK_06335 [gamma proteobacterium BDW918]|jgi:hypothetical protein|uniref:Uncharacterized protein n=1 Tax=Zhongshania aliphaticivorans TaxID=1470434 RepID=A0A127M7P4_9GAMM|nr:hypothetical protein [Zhongshania aliphaticivorans]AMO69262.1 hypothetical protein AZF00_13530 [Zhongshania aliphaticivorans]EIF43969.1 hypothetical protein DOK_06335 [gamma proteobacterium BDW918]